jgi:hypothetical protein
MSGVAGLVSDMTPEQLVRFDAASNHLYTCRCPICLEWWTQVPTEDDETEGEAP